MVACSVLVCLIVLVAVRIRDRHIYRTRRVSARAVGASTAALYMEMRKRWMSGQCSSLHPPCCRLRPISRTLSLSGHVFPILGIFLSHFSRTTHLARVASTNTIPSSGDNQTSDIVLSPFGLFAHHCKFSPPHCDTPGGTLYSPPLANANMVDTIVSLVKAGFTPDVDN